MRPFHLARRSHLRRGAVECQTGDPSMAKERTKILGTQVVSHIWAAVDSAGGTSSVSQIYPWFGKREGAPSQPMAAIESGPNLGAYRL